MLFENQCKLHRVFPFIRVCMLADSVYIARFLTLHINTGRRNWEVEPNGPRLCLSSASFRLNSSSVFHLGFDQ